MSFHSINRPFHGLHTYEVAYQRLRLWQPSASISWTQKSGVGGAPGTTAEARRASFTDSTVPATAADNGAQYIVQGFRGTRFGTPSDAIIVQFGNDGESFISGSNAATSIKMAA